MEGTSTKNGVDEKFLKELGKTRISLAINLIYYKRSKSKHFGQR